jgi:flavin reductase (DIM6/NTAB) family NADH-FMN oxidoreductase RutF
MIHDPKALRHAFGAFATGVTVITTRQPDGTPRGFTANSFTSVSLDPPLLLVCLAKTAHSAEVFATAPHFAVNILAEDQKAVSGLFASRAPDKFDQCAWTPGPADVPLIDGSLAQFACANHQIVDAGDHLILIGRVDHFATHEGQPLGYFRGNLLLHRHREGPGRSRGRREGQPPWRGPRLQRWRAPEGRRSLSLPLAPRPTLDSLTASLTALGLTPQIDFVYATFDDRTTGGHAVYYHGTVSGPLPQGFRIIPLADLAGAGIANPAEAAMLQRYAEDFRNGSFSIYHGTETTGQTRQIGA